MATVAAVGSVTVSLAAGPECLARWSVTGAAAADGDVAVVCRDGDPACDVDATVDGACTIQAAACVLDAGCGATVGAVEIRGAGSDGLERRVAALAMPLAGPACAAPASVRVPAGRARRTLRLIARTADGAARDRDRLRITCRRAATAGGARALVVTTDFESGLLATAAVAAPARHRVLPQAAIHSDAVIRVAGGIPFVLNRFLGDSVQRLDPARGFRTVYQCSTGAGSNPHDIAVAPSGKAWVSRYDRTQLWIVDPAARSCDRFQTGAVDLSAFADADGLPEMSQMALVGDRLFVSVERLDRAHRFAPSGPSRLVVLDAVTDAVVGEIRLPGSNAFGDSSGIVVEPGTGALLLGTPGDLYTVGDGGIVRVDPVAMVAQPGFVVTEDQIGGNITDFVVVSATQAYAVVQAANLQNRLVRFDPSGASPPRTLFARQAYLPDVALAPDGTLWLADESLEAPGIRRFDTATDAPLGGPVDFGLPPFSMGFVR